MWTKQPREVLDRSSRGVDYGTHRDVILRKGAVTLWRTRGHVAWSGIGSTSYYGPSWTIDNGSHREQVHLKGYTEELRVTNEVWRSWLPKIAKAMGLRSEELPQKIPRGCTMVWEDPKPGLYEITGKDQNGKKVKETILVTKPKKVRVRTIDRIVTPKEDR